MSKTKQGKSVSKSTKGQKAQGKDAKTGSLGMGDAFAYAVAGAEKTEKESKDSWLGVDKVSLDAKEFQGKDKLV